MKFNKCALIFTCVIYIFNFTPGAAGNSRYHFNKELLREIISRRNDLYYRGNDEGRIGMEDLPQNGELFEGDIVMDNDLRNAVLGNKRSVVTAAEVGHKKHWPDGRVPFEIHDSLSDILRVQVQKAKKEFEDCTCVRFVPKTAYDRDYVLFKDGKGCSSSVGRSGGRQTIHLAKGCRRIGTVMHEMMHAIGIVHEQSRADRDEYLSVKYENIKQDMTHNFNKYTYLQSDNMGIPYNYQSVMHYSNGAFSKNGKDTLVAKVAPELRFGQRTQLTGYDIEQINQLYPCPQKKGVCERDESRYDLVDDVTPSDVLHRKRDEEILERLIEKYRY